MKFKKEFLKKVLYGEAGTASVELDEIIDRTRWSLIRRLIFEFEGKLYETWYTEGSTEMQCGTPFEHAPEEVECFEVELRPVTTMEYVRVEDDRV